jgi:hypothetical protein
MLEISEMASFDFWPILMADLLFQDLMHLWYMMQSKRSVAQYSGAILFTLTERCKWHNIQFKLTIVCCSQNSFPILSTKFSFEKYYAAFSGKIPRKSWRRFSAHKPSMASFWATSSCREHREESTYIVEIRNVFDVVFRGSFRPSPHCKQDPIDVFQEMKRADTWI